MSVHYNKVTNPLCEYQHFTQLWEQLTDCIILLREEIRIHKTHPTSGYHLLKVPVTAKKVIVHVNDLGVWILPQLLPFVN